MLHTNTQSPCAVGADAGSPDSPDLKFVYEGDDAFSAIPSFGVIPAQVGFGNLMGPAQRFSFVHTSTSPPPPFPLTQGSLAQVMMGIDGLDFNPMMLLHGEQYLELHAPFPTEGWTQAFRRISILCFPSPTPPNRRFHPYTRRRGHIAGQDCGHPGQGQGGAGHPQRFGVWVGNPLLPSWL